MRARRQRDHCRRCRSLASRGEVARAAVAADCAAPNAGNSIRNGGGHFCGRRVVGPARARLENLLARGRESRRCLVRWGECARRAAVEQERLAEAHATELAAIIVRDFGGFVQAADPRAGDDTMFRRTIARHRPPALRVCLRDAVRDYQIDRRRRSNTPASPLPISSSVAGSGVAAPNSYVTPPFTR